ncbi:MAG: CHAT domain-containing protein [Ardenticatenales bacterium]|nr:CHAT domain-containing protein [Ardenticatenales bacterium]
MNRQALTKTIAGALFTGASLLSGNAAFVTIAGGLGINWASEGLGSLADIVSPPEAGSALARAHARALRNALSTLEAEYRRTSDPRGDGAAFALLALSADSLAQAEVTLPETPGLARAARTLADSLPALLHGHDERQVAWLQSRLLSAVARAFRAELEQDGDARQLFSMNLLLQIARHSQALGVAAAQLPGLLNALSTTSSQLDAIQRSQAALEDRLSQFKSGQGGKVTHESALSREVGSEAIVNIEGESSPPPAVPEHGEVINRSAIADKGGQATVNIRRIPGHPPPATRLPILALFADPAPRLEPLDLLREVRALEEAIRPHEQTFRLQTIEAATVDDLCRGLRDERPHLLHLAGHGSAQGFRFGDEQGNEHFVRWDDLAEEIAAHVPPLRAVIIAACHGADVARLRAPYIVAMHGSLADDVSVVFSQGFYEALVAAPTDIQSAYAAGCRRARLKLHCDEAALPVLHQNGSA